MGKMIAEDVKSHFKMIANSLNTYIESNDFKYILEIEKYLEQFFEVQSVKFWHYDVNATQLKLLDKESNNVLQVSSSLTQQVIDTKIVCIENHATSNKYFNAKIDNPLELKIKALLFFPIMKGSKIIGIVKLWRGLKQKKNFVKKDETNLSLFAPLFLDILEQKPIDKNNLHDLLNEKTERENVSLLKSSTKTSKVSVSKGPSEKKNNQKTIDLTNKLSNAQKKEKALHSELETLTKTLEELENNYKVLEASSVELYAESHEYQQKIMQLNELNKVLSTDNKDFKKELKKLKNSNQCNSIKELKSERALASIVTVPDIDTNIEHVFKRIDTRFNENEYSHIVFEILTYALSSKKGMSYIEESLRKSKLTQQLIDGYYFKGDLLLRQEKHRIADFVQQTKKYENDIFTNVKLNISINDAVPSSLVLDATKIQNIILHLLVDLYQFVDHSRTIDVDFDFKKKFLSIELGGAIHQKNSLFQSMFKQTKLGGDEKDRLGLQLSKKVVSRLKGEINTLYEDDYYKFIVTVPAQVIKM